MCKLLIYFIYLFEEVILVIMTNYIKKYTDAKIRVFLGQKPQTISAYRKNRDNRRPPRSPPSTVRKPSFVVRRPPSVDRHPLGERELDSSSFFFLITLD